jgi:chemotaxis methyl-accepting protein methylase
MGSDGTMGLRAIKEKAGLVLVQEPASAKFDSVSKSAIAAGQGRAGQGFYPANIVADISPGRLKRFFIKEENSYRIGKEIREMVTFATQNVIMDPPFTKLDILICRNLLIYLTPELHKKLLQLFHYSLNPNCAMRLAS